MQYDNGGNTSHRTISGVGTDFTFDDEGRFAAATVHAAGGNQTTGHLYDAGGTLLIRRDPTGVTLYAAGQEHKLANGAVTGKRYYSRAGALVCVRSSAGVHWLAANSQGSEDLAVNAATGNYQRRWYTPYGNDRATNGTWPTDRGFLDKQANVSTGLLDVGAREYDPNLGSFISPDPIINISDPITFNAYAYAGHSPVAATDGSGLSVERSDFGYWIWSQYNRFHDEAAKAFAEKIRNYYDNKNRLVGKEDDHGGFHVGNHDPNKPPVTVTTDRVNNRLKDGSKNTKNQSKKNDGYVDIVCWDCDKDRILIWEVKYKGAEEATGISDLDHYLKFKFANPPAKTDPNGKDYAGKTLAKGEHVFGGKVPFSAYGKTGSVWESALPGAQGVLAYETDPAPTQQPGRQRPGNPPGRGGPTTNPTAEPTETEPPTAPPAPIEAPEPDRVINFTNDAAKVGLTLFVVFVAAPVLIIGCVLYCPGAALNPA